MDGNDIIIPTAPGFGGSIYAYVTRSLTRCYVFRLIYTGSSILGREPESGYPVPTGSAYGCFAVGN